MTVSLRDIPKRRIVASPPADLPREVAELTPQESELVRPHRVKECPVHMEARVTAMHKLSGEKLQELGGGFAAEIEVLRVHAASDLILKDNYIDPRSGRR